MEFQIDHFINQIKNDNIDYFTDALNKIRNSSFSFQNLLQNYNQILGNNPPMISVICYFGAIKCLKYLIDKKYSLKVVDDLKRAIQFYAVSGGYISIIEVLSKHQIDFSNYTHLAAKLENCNVLRFLINDLCCDPTTVDSSNQSLLHYAAINGDTNTTKFLIDLNKIDINCKDKNVIFN